MNATLSVDATRIIGQLDANHAANTAAGYGSPALDDFYHLVVKLIAAAADPKATMGAIADLLADHVPAGRPSGGAR